MSKDSNEYVQKPPLGLKPEWIHKELRLKEVDFAIGRYMDALKEVPSEWIEERYQLRKWLQSWEASKAPSPIIEKKDWEIVSCYNEGHHDLHDFIPNPDPKGGIPCMKMGCKIWSVRHVSDSVVFTVGDKIFPVGGEVKIIERFFIYNNTLLYFETNNGKDTWSFGDYFSHAPIPVREVLFTTYNKKEIFEGDDFYIALMDSGSVRERTATKDDKGYWQEAATFTTRELAEDFIILNKKVFSVSDLEDFVPTLYYHRLKDLAKQKIDAKIQ